jgi:hypothetical protein
MKIIGLVLVTSLLAGCAPTLKSSPSIALTAGSAATAKSTSGIPIKAVYLVQGAGQLPQEDLQAHPEVIATDSFAEFKDLAHSKVALWIDINAVGLVDIVWLGQRPQLFYPVVLVGNGDDFCSFFVILRYFYFSVPPGDYDCSSPPAGFSVNIQRNEFGGFNHGYKQTPTVQAILDITNPMLEKVK